MDTASNDTAAALRREIDRLRSDLDRLRSDLSNLAGDAVEAVRAGAAQAKERAAERASAAAARGRESAEFVEDQIAAHPFAALATALAVGLVAGVALSRRN